MRRIIASIGEVLSLILPMTIVTVITVVIAVAPFVMFSAITGFISVRDATECGMLVGALLACGILTALINHYRHCDSGCRRAA